MQLCSVVELYCFYDPFQSTCMKISLSVVYDLKTRLGHLIF